MLRDSLEQLSELPWLADFKFAGQTDWDFESEVIYRQSTLLTQWIDARTYCLTRSEINMLSPVRTAAHSSGLPISNERLTVAVG
jgi:hypothetical protein